MISSALTKTNALGPEMSQLLFNRFVESVDFLTYQFLEPKNEYLLTRAQTTSKLIGI